MASARAGLIGAALLLASLAGCGAANGTMRVAPSTVSRAVVSAQRPDLLVLSAHRGGCHLLLNSGARVTAAVVAAATVTVNARARLTVSGP